MSTSSLITIFQLKLEFVASMFSQGRKGGEPGNQWCKVQNQLHTQPTHAVRCKELNPGHGKDKWVLSAIPALCDVRVKFSKKFLPVRAKPLARSQAFQLSSSM